MTIAADSGIRASYQRTTPLIVRSSRCLQKLALNEKRTININKIDTSTLTYLSLTNNRLLFIYFLSLTYIMIIAADWGHPSIVSDNDTLEREIKQLMASASAE